MVSTLFEPVYSTWYMLAYASIEDSEELANLSSLTRDFSRRSMNSQCPENLDFDQTVWMGRLIPIFAVSACRLVSYAKYLLILETKSITSMWLVIFITT